MTRASSRPGITDVAKLAGVSLSTVSRAMNGNPTVDPALALAVLNGTATAGLAANAGDALAAAGWSVPTVANANTEEETATTIYYTDPALEGAALGVAQSLGVGTPALTQDFVETGSVVVVLGSDYPPQ